MAEEAEPRPAAKERLRAVGERCICLHTRMAARAVTRAYDAALAPLGLEGTQFTLLSAIAVDPTRSVTAMADRLALERSSLSRNLTLLKQRGLIAQAGGRGRAVRYAVTEAGLALMETALPAWDAVQRRLEAEIGESGWSELRGGLRRIRRAAAPD